MADKVDKPKKQKAKAKADEKGVLAALPSTRPERIGTRRGAGAPAPKTTTATRASKAAATKASAKPAKQTPAAAASRAPARTKPAAAKPRVTASRRKAAAPRTFEPTAAAETAAGAAEPASLRSSPQPAGAGARVAGAEPRAERPRAREERTYPRPRPVSEGARGIGTPGYRDGKAEESGRPGGVELAATAVRAAGEVAQLGLSIGGAVLKGAVKRIPKP